MTASPPSKSYVLASSTPWALQAFVRRRAALPGQWTCVLTRDDLATAVAANPQARYIFFPHWSWIVPDAILARYECVCFHMTDLPFGRGGSPLQNLVARGITSTKLCALRMTAELDAGPIYARRDLALHGPARDIFARAAELSLDLVEWLVAHEPEPAPQTGEVTRFERRTPNQSILPTGGSPETLYNHIRMLDADGYPRAFIEHGGWRIELDEARLEGGVVEARARIAKCHD